MNPRHQFVFIVGVIALCSNSAFGLEISDNFDDNTRDTSIWKAPELTKDEADSPNMDFVESNARLELVADAPPGSLTQAQLVQEAGQVLPGTMDWTARIEVTNAIDVLTNQPSVRIGMAVFDSSFSNGASLLLKADDGGRRLQSLEGGLYRDVSDEFLANPSLLRTDGRIEISFQAASRTLAISYANGIGESLVTYLNPDLSSWDSVEDKGFVIALFATSAGTTVVSGEAYLDNFSLAIGPEIPPEATGRLVNLSTRGRTGSGSETMIAGFVIRDGSKRLLLRAAGATLAGAPFNVPGTVEDPRLRLFDQTTGLQIGLNDNWDGNDPELIAAIVATGAFPFVAGSNEAAMVVELNPGPYSVHVESVTGNAGNTIVELYELDETGRLVNISTRGFAGVGDDIMIPGTVVANDSARLLIRAVGESLGQPPFNVPGVLEDPVLELWRLGGASAIFTNDDWGSAGDESEIVVATEKVGAFALLSGSRDAVLLVTVQPGVYTAHVRGKDGATGVVLVEIYAIP